jgi:hypothetical protein
VSKCDFGHFLIHIPSFCLGSHIPTSVEVLTTERMIVRHYFIFIRQHHIYIYEALVRCSINIDLKRNNNFLGWMIWRKNHSNLSYIKYKFFELTNWHLLKDFDIKWVTLKKKTVFNLMRFSEDLAKDEYQLVWIYFVLCLWRNRERISTIFCY